MPVLRAQSTRNLATRYGAENVGAPEEAFLFSILARLSPLEFEKDDDRNGHIDYITACSVC